jgi:hypothetical protein
MPMTAAERKRRQRARMTPQQREQERRDNRERYDTLVLCANMFSLTAEEIAGTLVSVLDIHKARAVARALDKRLRKPDSNTRISTPTTAR